MFYILHPTTRKEEKENIERTINESDLKYTREECVSQLRDTLLYFARDGYPDYVMGLINDINVDCRQPTLKEYCEYVINEIEMIHPNCKGRVIYRGIYFDW